MSGAELQAALTDFPPIRYGARMVFKGWGIEAMRRREFITLLGSAAAWPLAARAQQPDRMRLIGVLMASAESDSTPQSWLAAFRAALAKWGWTEGSNLRIELRWSAADPEKIRTFAKELVDLRPDAIFGQSTPAIGVLARERRTVPN